MNQNKKDIQRNIRGRAHNIKNKLIEYQLATPEQIIGCNKEEIIEIEKAFGIELPYSYKVFLEYFGKKMGKYFFSDVEILYEDLSEVIYFHKDYILDPEDHTFPENSMIFACRQGIQFLFFKLEMGNDDPSVFNYGGRKNIFQTASSIFDILESDIEIFKKERKI